MEDIRKRLAEEYDKARKEEKEEKEESLNPLSNISTTQLKAELRRRKKKG